MSDVAAAVEAASIIKRAPGGRIGTKRHTRSSPRLTTSAGNHPIDGPQFSRASVEEPSSVPNITTLTQMVLHADADHSYGNANGGFSSLGNGGYMKRGGHT